MLLVLVSFTLLVSLETLGLLMVLLVSLLMGGGTVNGLLSLLDIGLSDTPEDMVDAVASSAATEATTKPAGNITAVGEQSKNENEATFSSYNQILLTFFKFFLGCFMFSHYCVTLRTHNKYLITIKQTVE